MAFVAAKYIYGNDARNAQLIKIIDKSIELERFGLAVEVADFIYGTNPRNKEYKKIIDRGMANREKEASKKQMESIK